MKLVVLFLMFLLGWVMVGCKGNSSPVAKLFREHLEKEICLEGFKEVYSEQYPGLYVSYIDEECGSCVFKIREWYKYSETLPMYDKLAYVFVFRGEDYRKFLKYRIGKHPSVPFYYLSSEEFTYIINNPEIDRQIIDGGFLLDYKNRIKVIGSPLKSQSLRKLIEKRLYE